MKKKLVKGIRLELPENKVFLLVGAGDPIKVFMKKLRNHFPSSPIMVISDKKCDEAWSVYENTIEIVSSENNAELDFVEDINAEEVIYKVKKFGCNTCFVLGARWILKKELIDLFGGMIFNYHPTNLPKYRGSGGWRWQVMNQEKSIYVSFHQLVVELDKGPVFFHAKKNLKNTIDIYPKNIFEELHIFMVKCFEVFLKRIKIRNEINLTGQNQSAASYFPILDNEINGAIDFSWNVGDIKLFVNAFSYPYRGAFVYYKDKKVFIREAKVSNRRDVFHPYAEGLIINRTDELVEVAGRGGSILFKDFSDDAGKKIDLVNFRPGGRFYVPSNELLLAKTYRPSNKSFILKVDNTENKNS